MIGTMSLTQLAKIVGSSLFGADATFERVSTDTRSISPGDLFVALSGANFDGNTFVSLAERSGASGALVSAVQQVTIGQVVVQDTLKALGLLGANNRQSFSGKVVGITGSSGKTTVKEMVASILATQGLVTATKGNLNNHIGVPLTLLAIDASHQYAVVEMGASAAGEINYTATLAKPDIAIITNAGEAHLEGFGSYENIVQAKAEILQGLSANGIAILNMDDPAFSEWKLKAGAKKILGFSAKGNVLADISARKVGDSASGCQFELQGKGLPDTTVNLSVAGEHNIANALAAGAAALALGLSAQQVKTGLESFLPAKGRQQQHELGNMIVIDDTYNANPTSVKAGLAVLASAKGIKIAILGEMGELGTQSAELHEGVGRYAATSGVDYLFTIGQHAKNVQQGFVMESLAADETMINSQVDADVANRGKLFESKQDLITSLMVVIEEIEKTGHGVKPIVYVKGSRSARMEDITQQLLHLSMEASC